MNMHKIYKNMNSLSDNRLRISRKENDDKTLAAIEKPVFDKEKTSFFFSFLTSLDPQYKSHNYKMLIKDVIGLLIIWIAQNSFTPQLVFYGQKQQRPQWFPSRNYGKKHKFISVGRGFHAQ